MSAESADISLDSDFSPIAILSPTSTSSSSSTVSSPPKPAEETPAASTVSTEISPKSLKMTDNNPFGDDMFGNDGTRKTSVTIEATEKPKENHTEETTTPAATPAASNPNANAAPAATAAPAASGKDEKKDKPHPSKITVGEAELRGGRFTGFHAYKVTTEPPVVDHVFRRFNDFVWLREILVKLYPAVFIPPLPPKKILGSKDDDTVVERRAELERFLNRVALRPFLAESEPFQIFLYRATLFEEGVKELDKQAKSKEVTEHTLMLKDKFTKEIAEITLSDKTDQEFDSLREFLKNSEEKTGNMLKAADLLAENFEKYLDSIAKLNSALNHNYDVEKGYPDRPQPARVDVLENFLAWQQGEKELLSAYHDHLHTTFKYELQDVQAYSEIVKYRYDIHLKYQATLKKAKTWDGKVLKNEKQEAEKQADIAREQHEREFLEIINKIILQAQIKHYWAAKVAIFKKQIALFATAQTGANSKLRDAWESCQKLARSKSISERMAEVPDYGLDEF